LLAATSLIGFSQPKGITQYKNALQQTRERRPACKLANMRIEIKRGMRAGRCRLSKQRRTLSRERKFSPVRPSRTRALYPTQHKSKASETRRARQHCSARRHVVYAWLVSLAALTGGIERLPREQRGTSTECRLSELHPAIRIFMSGTTLAASVHYRGRCWDVLECFEAVPKQAALGWVNGAGARGQPCVHASADALWKTEVFDRFREWFELTLPAAEVVILYGTDDGATWAQFMPFATPPAAPFEMARFPVWRHRVPPAA
jgi:hypothetical protein